MILQSDKSAADGKGIKTSLPHAARLAAMKEAEGLINPASGLANDYLNHYNEVLLLIENLPVLLPEMVEELVNWEPVSYQDYFNKSPLVGSKAAVLIYNSLNPQLRSEFEGNLNRINALASESISTIKEIESKNGSLESESIENYCQAASAEIRTAIEAAMDLVNYGLQLPSETPQGMVDRILSHTASAAPAHVAEKVDG